MFEVSEESCCLHIRMTSALEKIDEAWKLVGRFLQKLGIECYSFEIQLLTREALINAIMHGNSNDPTKEISYEIRLEGDHLVIDVEDEGEGFDWPACVGKEPEVTSESGRGLLIMRELSTDMAYNSKGNRLVLKRKIG